MAQDHHADLIEKIRSKNATIGVIGLGYVGLPTCLNATERGFNVLGFDINSERVARINDGESVIKHIPPERFEAAIGTGRFAATSDFSRLNEPDALLIAVPTPLTRHREPDLSFVRKTAEDIASHLRKGQIVILESTTYPGTTDEVVKPVLEGSGLTCGVDFFLAYSPEREDPGNANFSTNSIPKVVSGDGSEALSIATALYEQLVDEVVPVSSPATAEAVKLTENIYRAVNIALVNELKTIYGEMGIDVWEVIEAAKTKPFGFTAFYPGPGLGGHCVPIDPFYLTWKAREYDISTRFIELAGQINTKMPYQVVDKVAEAIDQRLGRGMNGARILVLGLAYKKNVDDLRESPSLKLMELLEARSASADYHDPFIEMIPQTRHHAALSNRDSVALTSTNIAGYDAILIATDHDDLDYEMISQNARLIVDTRNVMQRMGFDNSNVVKA